MEKKGFNELKQLFEKKRTKEKNKSSSKNKKKENKKDKKKQEKIKKEKNKQEDFPQRTLTLANNEIESVRKSLVKNVNQNNKNDKINNNNNKETPNELDKIKNNLVKTNTFIIGNTIGKNVKTEENGGVKNTIEKYNKSVNDNKGNKKEINNTKNNISNTNKDTNKNRCNDVKKETNNDKNNATNTKNEENKTNLSSYLYSFFKSKSFIPFIKDNTKMEIKSFKTNNKVINENENKVFEKSFDKLVNLQVLLKKESSLKELCKYLL